VDLVRGEIDRLLSRGQTAVQEGVLNKMREMLTRSPEGINICVCSFSESRDSLSQWRAYGGSSGFAIGISQQVLKAAVERQKFSLAKCIYDPATQLDIVKALVGEVLDEYVSKDPGIEGWDLNGEDAQMFWDTGGNLLNYLYRYAPMLKDRAFEEEREWRIISSPILAHSFDYREGRSLIIPYYCIPLWEKGQRTEIHEIVVGPTQDIDRSIKSLRKMIMGRDVIGDRSLNGHTRWGYTPITPSQVPYRDW
jgi:hypothetical protein